MIQETKKIIQHFCVVQINKSTDCAEASLTGKSEASGEQKMKTLQNSIPEKFQKAME